MSQYETDTNWLTNYRSCTHPPNPLPPSGARVCVRACLHACVRATHARTRVWLTHGMCYP
jgi:hypothetical protein